MRKKVPLEVKMEALKLLQSGESANAVSKQLSISNGELQTWSLIYAKEGERGLAVYPKNVCIGKIKDKIICTYRQKRVPLHTHFTAQALTADEEDNFLLFDVLCFCLRRSK